MTILIKQNRPTQSVRAWQCITQIDKLKKAFLKSPFITGFIHDITYGKGQVSILTHNKEYLNFFHTNQFPAIFTDESGRILPKGVYFTHLLPMTNKEEFLFNSLKNTLGFEYLLHIVKHEKNLQHTYSFFLRCNESQLLFFIANKLQQLKQFIGLYERRCKQEIEFVMAEKNHLILPYGGGNAKNISSILQSLDLEEKEVNNDLCLPHALNNQWVKLTQQQIRCFKLLLLGKTAKEIAQDMNLSFRTIQHYTATIYERLGLKNSRELIATYSYLTFN